MTVTTVLDLFSGACGGWSLGMHRAGFKTVAACEADPWRRSVYARNFPGVKLYEDVRTLRSTELVRDLGRLPDVIVGSPPCQDASAANTKGRGVDGERTGLFFEAIRIVGECRPRWCAFENSPRLRTRGVDRLLVELEALGYTCWPFVVGADDLGAPHKRDRIWLVAADADQAGPSDGRAVPSLRTAEIPRIGCGDQGSVVAHTNCDREPIGAEHDEVAECSSAGVLSDDAWAHWNGGLAGHLRMDDGLSARVASSRGTAGAIVAAYGDAVVPQITEAIGRAILRVESALACVGRAA